MADGLEPLPAPDCIDEVEHVSLAFECCAELIHAGLVLITDQAFVAFACLGHESELIAARRRPDCGRQDSNVAATAGREPASGTPLPIGPLGTGTAAQRLAQEARARTADRAEDGQPERSPLIGRRSS